MKTLFLSFVFLVGCGDPEAPRVYATGVVSDVRMTFELDQQRTTEGGNPVAGALIGHTIAGKAGAIVGAIAESDSAKIIPPRGRLVACSFKVTIPSGEFVVVSRTQNYEGAYAGDVQKCSLMRDGDTVTLKRYVSEGGWFYPD